MKLQPRHFVILGALVIIALGTTSVLFYLQFSDEQATVEKKQERIEKLREDNEQLESDLQAAEEATRVAEEAVQNMGEAGLSLVNPTLAGADSQEVLIDALEVCQANIDTAGPVGTEVCDTLLIGADEMLSNAAEREETE